jgi:hypothetical protein
VSKNDNHRSIKQVVDFPKQIFLYESVQLRLKLECPQPTCDAWDRRGAIYLYRDNMKTDDAGQRVELARFVTPYGVGTSWTVDIAPLAPLLVGKRTLELEIDTWVGPGHPQGAGWLVTAEVEMKGGRPKEYPVAVISVFHPQDVEVGDPAKDPRRVFTHEVPISDVSSAKLVAIITGHGQGNSENCAEFCPKTHNFTIGGKLQQRRVWRDNCAQTVADQSQRGTWTLSRAGWCPGAAVKPLIFDLGAGQARLAIEYEPQTYANQARSGYNDGSHTPPYYRMSAVVVLYRQL